MEFKGTKGKWFLNSKFNTIVDEQGLGIAQEHGLINNSQWQDNAKLISASPDLLESLIECVKTLKLEGWTDNDGVLKKANEAINKAIK